MLFIRHDSKAKRRINLIGTVQSMLLWILSYNGKLLLLQPIRAKEQLIFKHLLDQHALQVESLESAIKLNKRLLDV
jgi:hypothetical protein